MGHFCNETCLFSCLRQIISHLPFPVGSAQGFRKQARMEGITRSFPLPDSGYRETLQASTVSQSLLSGGGMVTSTVVTFLMFSVKSHSSVSVQERRVVILKVKDITPVFALFGFHSMKRQIVNRMRVFPDH